MDKYKTYTNAFIRYGRAHQSTVAIEELSECQKELWKFIRGYGDKEHLAEEVADCIIVLEQVIMNYGIENLVTQYMDEKLQRLENKLREESLKDG